MKLLKNKRYQELLIAEARAKDLDKVLLFGENSAIAGEQIQREWDRTLGRGIRLDYR